jgi:hypothetical protein
MFLCFCHFYCALLMHRGVHLGSQEHHPGFIGPGGVLECRFELRQRILRRDWKLVGKASGGQEFGEPISNQGAKGPVGRIKLALRIQVPQAGEFPRKRSQDCASRIRCRHKPRIRNVFAASPLGGRACRAPIRTLLWYRSGHRTARPWIRARGNWFTRGTLRTPREGMNSSARSHVASSFTLIKGAMIDETYAVFGAWDFALSKRENLDRLRREKFIGASTTTWLRDVAKVLNRRFNPNGRDRPLVLLAKSDCPIDEWKPLLLWHMTRDEFLLRDFLINWLFPTFVSGTYCIRTDDLYAHLQSIGERGGTTEHAWSKTTVTRVATALLKIAVDFGLLRGSVVKESASYHLLKTAVRKTESYFLLPDVRSQILKHTCPQ